VRRARRASLAMLLLAGLAVSGCARSSPSEEDTSPPAKVVELPGDHRKGVVLTASAARRLSIRTAPVHSVRREPETGGASVRMAVVPYSAVFYDSEGEAFAYTKRAPLIFVRRSIEVDDIERPDAFLLKGPPAGTEVVTVGARELLGIEAGVQE
jgi:hypothetical protein